MKDEKMMKKLFEVWQNVDVICILCVFAFFEILFNCQSNICSSTQHTVWSLENALPNKKCWYEAEMREFAELN